MDIRNIKELLKIVKEEQASDLHLSAGLPPVARLNGILKRFGTVTLSNTDIVNMLQDILPNGNRKHALSLGKEIDLGIELEGIARFRLNIYHDRKGICAAFRLIPLGIQSLDSLGLPPVVGSVCKMTRGLVIVTGITGSGKSTTLAAIIDKINNERNKHIITIEDPIEFIHEDKKSIINQREVGVNTSSFANALRGALREDPDIILVGEMRDLETVSLAITAAETGHFVFTTLHTRGAVQSIDRIIDVFPPHQQEQIRIQLAETLEMIISQVLLPSKYEDRRHLACEILVATRTVKQLIRQKKNHQIKSEIQIGVQWGMQTLEKSLKSLVNAGSISKEIALQWITDKKLFESA